MDSVAQGLGTTTPASSLTPTLSVVIPIHNVEPWIAECLRSIQVQLLSSLEIILVDDESADRTVDIVRALAAADPRIRLLANPGSGSASARNYGVSVATGTFLAFADGDDLVPQGAYEALVRSLRHSGSDMSMGDYLTFTTSKTWRRGNNLPVYGAKRIGISLADEPRLLRDRVCWNKVYRLDWWRWHDIRFADSRRSNDIFAMTLAYAMATMDIIPVTTYLYRRRSDGSSMTSRRGALDSLVQHFTQEVSCFRVVAATCEERVQLAYLRGVLEHDMWGPLEALVRRDAPGTEEDRRVVEEIFALATELIVASPWSVRKALKARQRWTYDLIAAREVDLLPLLPGQLPVAQAWRRLVDQPEKTFDEYARWATLLGDSTKDTFRQVLAGVLIPGLSVESAGVDDETLRSLAALVVQFQRRWVPRARLTERQLRVVLTAARGDTGALRDAIRAELMAAVPMVVKSSGLRHLTLVLPAARASASHMPRLITIDRSSEQSERSFSGTREVDGAVSFTVDASVLGQQTNWDVLLAPPSTDPAANRQYVAAEGSLPSTSRWDALFVKAARTGPPLLTIHVKPSVGVRAGLAVRRRLVAVRRRLAGQPNR
jgi:hypothetical protein